MMSWKLCSSYSTFHSQHLWYAENKIPIHYLTWGLLIDSISTVSWHHSVCWSDERLFYFFKSALEHFTRTKFFIDNICLLLDETTIRPYILC